MFRLLKSANLKVSRLNLNAFKRCNSDVASASSIPSPQTNPEILYTGVSFHMAFQKDLKIFIQLSLLTCLLSLDIYQ